MTINVQNRNGVMYAALAITACTATFSPAWAQLQTRRSEFEVATIRPSGDCAGGGQPQPGRLALKCVSVSALIQMAYGYFGNGVSYTANILQVRGAPGWLSSDHYDVTATAEGNPSQAVMRGPMLRALLEDRFHLQFHRATEEGPVYLLTTVKSGLKIQKLAADACVPADLQPSGKPQSAVTAVCGKETRKNTGRTLSVSLRGVSMSALADGLLSQLAERTVIDKSGLTGLFDIQLQYTPNQEVRPDETGIRKSDDTELPSLFTSVQEQLGLKLTAAKGPVAVFVIDRVEKPSAN